MRSHLLYLPSLVVAGLGAAFVPLGFLIAPVRATLIYPMTLFAAGVTTVLFFRMLFDPRCRNGVNAASLEIRKDPKRFGMRRAFSDPKWGLFGSRLGGRPLQIIRAVLWFEFLAALLMTTNGRADLLLLSAASFAVAMMLSIIHAGLTTELRPA